MPRCLVTGASGFLGRTLVRSLEERGNVVVALSSATGDVAESRTFQSHGAVDHVFHLAARTFVPDSWSVPAEFHKTNVLGTTNALEFCRRTSATLTFVSGYVYGIPECLPIRETFRPRPNNPYALSKYLAEQVCEFYAEHHGVKVTIVRPFNIYGPRQGEQFLIPKIVGAVRSREAIRVNDLRPSRDYVFISDVVDALIRASRLGEGYEIFNVGAGRAVTVAELIATIQSAAGTNLDVICAGERRCNEVDEVCADISKAERVLGWHPRVSLREGIGCVLAGD